MRIHTDFGVICAYIPGSFPTADAAPDPEKNRLCLCLRLADEIRLSLADTIPVIVADVVISKQLFKGHTAALLPAGDYKFVVRSCVGDAESPLLTTFRRVKYFEVIDPPEPRQITITDAKAIASGGIVTVAAGCSSLVPTSKTQTLSVIGIGIPAIAVVSSSSQGADASGGDENKPT